MTNASSSLLLNGSPDDMLSEILALMLTLRRIYEAEHLAMNTRRLKDFVALQSEKEIATRNFEIGLKAVKAKGDTIKSASPALRETLILLQTDLDYLAEQSMKWSLRMVESVRRMQTRLIGAARAAMEKDKCLYNPRGSMNDMGTRVQATAINQSF
jgi:hypothetical protein